LLIAARLVPITGLLSTLGGALDDDVTPGALDDGHDLRALGRRDRELVEPIRGSTPIPWSTTRHHKVPPAGFKYLVTEMLCWAAAVDEVVYDGRDAVDTAEPLVKVGRILRGHWHRLLLPHAVLVVLGLLKRHFNNIARRLLYRCKREWRLRARR
jgi:hypothetical protein